ncbi:thioredoxin family protein [Muriicola sp. Z0-33]|uniref:thioredoxin family protein n=1 Tax=Muriicola sp. Z0-33 TaxID=2816957 RepID=UPI00223906AB|nr:thioredoxin family protein [Muriicola sp. Z0-33]MCW5516313.1 thioredoxin family protein [Muriicola sp. Z0-33]
MKNVKHILLLLALISFTNKGTSQETNYQITDQNGRVKLLGVINKDGLMKPPFQSWYKSGFNSYQLDMATIASFEKELGNYTIKVFMGTWCGDSKREIPRFYKVLDATEYPEKQLITIAVDYVKPNYKKSPGGEEKGMNIIKVPTFIFYKNGKEVNRIIESPVASFEKDMAAILSGKDYVPNYSNMPVLPVD